MELISPSFSQLTSKMILQAYFILSDEIEKGGLAPVVH